MYKKNLKIVVNSGNLIIKIRFKSLKCVFWFVRVIIRECLLVVFEDMFMWIVNLVYGILEEDILVVIDLYIINLMCYSNYIVFLFFYIKFGFGFLCEMKIYIF